MDLLQSASAGADGKCLDDFAPEDSAQYTIEGATLLLTTDMSPIITHDPRDGGYILALHSFNDIYARGGIPTAALLTLVAEAGTGLDDAAALLRGVRQACAEENVWLAGGHSLIGGELLAGVTAVGKADGACFDKRAGRAGDLIILSKPCGTGVSIAAARLGLTHAAEYWSAVEIMKMSNRRFSASLREIETIACTDVSGFGFLGHLSEMLPNGVGAEISLSKVPKCNTTTVPHTVWMNDNFEYAAHRHDVRYEGERLELQPLLFPQMNGGLIAIVSGGSESEALQRGFFVVGTLTDGNRIAIHS